jgi:phosphatidylserine decarboxylase
VSERLVVSLQYVLPKLALPVLAGNLAGLRGGSLSTAVISWFVSRYAVDMAEAANPDVTAYPSFNEFFTRPLREGARPLAEAEYVCPVDGAISQFGAIEQNRIFQAKEHDYTARALVGGDAELARRFTDGAFATLYLSPRDYHRIHMPCSGKLLRMIYVPGDLFSVNPATARGVPGLFARNERVVCEFEADFGRFVMVLVGATIVGSMATVWHGVVNPPRSRMIEVWRYDDQQITLESGAEMGRFMLGSTVVMLFPKDAIAFNPEWAPAAGVRMGEMMGNRPADGARS